MNVQCAKLLGKYEDDLILSTNQKTYKLRGINLPTSMLVITQKGSIDLQLSHFIKLQDYDHQYHKIYQMIKYQAPSQQQFSSHSIQQLIQKFGIDNNHIRNNFKISIKQFNQFEENVDFLSINGKRLFIPVEILLKIMRNFIIFVTERNLFNIYFLYEDVQEIKYLECFQMFQLIIKKFMFQVIEQQMLQNLENKMELEKEKEKEEDIGKNQRKRKYKLTYESIYNFVLIQLALAKNQYISTQMQQLIKGMLNVYIPLGMQIPSAQQQKQISKRLTSKYFVQAARNNTNVRIHYDPLQIQSSLKGRIKFMSTFKNRFTKQQIKGVFSGLILKQNSKQIKQSLIGGRKSLDIDDLLLKNFRKFNQLYEIKLILPK